MPHFLIKKEEKKDNFIELLDNENIFHLTKVLRVKIGQKIKFIDEDKNVYFCEIKEVLKNSLRAQILETKVSNRVLKNNICLIQSIVASDAQNLLIANAVQTGVKKIYPVISDNVSVSLNSLKGKVEKWNKISLENFKQCERADMATIEEIQNLKEALSQFKKENILIFAEKYENSTLNDCLSNVDKNDKIAIVIGPEGGFSQSEFEYFISQGYKLITLGKMIYKAPNAVVAAVSNVVSRME
ncbi:MAG: RsmE family RNA methyltransferase [Candidatus Gastranaerophilales bacterium]|nr:RsmE family RNA methyltransferase [Candidatus Gastranaerophilales bacterium]